MKAASPLSIASRLRRPLVIATLVSLTAALLGLLAVRWLTGTDPLPTPYLLGAIALGTVLAWILSKPLLARTSDKLERLAAGLERAARERDYSLRLAADDGDGVDRMLESFNTMLAKLSEDDSHLARQRQRLEQDFAERVGELSKANAELKQWVAEASQARHTAEQTMAGNGPATPGRGRFLEETSHEIHTQLNSLIGMSELLLSTYLSPQQHRYAGALTRAGRSLQAVIGDILDVAMIDAGRIRLDRAEFELTWRIEETIDLFAERALAKGLELTGNLSRDLPYRVSADQARVGQILSYLIGAAVEHASEGDVLVRARLQTRAGDQARVRIELSGRGIDIAAITRDADFAAFTRPPGAVERDYGRSGLGLAIARELVEIMGGTAGCEGDPDEGTRLWVLLPLTVTQWSAPRPAARDWIAGRRLLVVAPDGACRTAVRTYAVEAGAEVVLSADVDAAHAALTDARAANMPFDILVLDSRVPGFASLASRTARQDVPIDQLPARILMVPPGAWRSERSLGLAIDASLSKPVRRHRLIDCLAGMLGHPVAPEPGLAGRGLPHDGTQTQPLGLRVLIADDNPVNQDTAAAMLAVLGCETRSVFDGQAAIDACIKETFDLVLMDCKMPLMDGYEATRRIRLQESNRPDARLPIIALTAHAMSGDQDRCHAAGMDGYLTKPISLSALRATILRWSSKPGGRSAALPPPGVDPGPLLRHPPSAAFSGTPLELGDLAALPLVDPATLDEIMAISPESGLALVARLIRNYLDSAPGLAARIREGLELELPQRVAESAHALRSAAATLGAARMAALCGRLEQIAKPGITPYPVAEIAFALDRLETETRMALQARLGEPAEPVERPDDAASLDLELTFVPTGTAACPTEPLPEEPRGGVVKDERRSKRERPLILLVDDNPSIHDVARTTFDRFGFRFASARDGQGALETVRFQRPDLIVLDVMMPGMNGYETCRRLRAQPGLELIPILMMTGLEDVASIERAYESGATDFYAKPINWTLLVHRIRYLLRGHVTLSALHRSEASNGALIAAIPDALIRLDRQGRVLQYKAGLVARKVRHLDDATVTELSDLLPEAVCATIRRELETTLTERGVRELEIEIADEIDEALAFEARLIAIDDEQVILLLRDMTERRRRQRVIQQLAYQDSLTGLANRQQFNQDLAAALSRARRREDGIVLLYLDLDQFKRINDSLGHGVGDDLLRGAAKRLRDAVDAATSNARVRGGAVAKTVARLGGDELTVILKGSGAKRIATQVAEIILERFREPFRCSGHRIVCTVSIGIAVSPEDGDTAETLLKHADTALYAAKLKGRNTYRLYTPSMGELASRKLDVEARLRRALDRGDFRLHYQPVIDVATGDTLSVEALLRWEDPERGLLEPASFIRVAEESGLILPIGAWVIDEIGHQQAAWASQGLSMPLSVNLSDCQFSDQALIERLLLLAMDQPAGAVELEVTESLLLAQDARLIDTLGMFRRRGLRIAIDNFGTGYSSLGLLKHLPIDTLKIDRSFVREIGRDAKSDLLVRTIISLGKGLGLRLVAQGVETDEQRSFLADAGCHAAQGYLFANPAGPADLDVKGRSDRAASGDAD